MACAVVLLLSARPPVRLSAQSTAPLTLAGRLVLARATDTVPLAGTWVVAHRIGPRRQGPIDSLRSDAAGRFRFRVAAPESAAAYVVSAQYAGIGYFSPGFDAAAREGTDRIALAVFDTASAGAPLGVRIRHVVVTRPAEDGSRRVLDIVTVHNATLATRVARDTTAPTWRMRLPEGMGDFEVGEGDVAASAVRFDSGAVLVSAPFPPGEKQVVVTYVVPAGAARFIVPIDQATALFEVLAEDSLSAPLPPLVADDPLPIEGRVFQRFTATDLTAGAAPAIRFAPARDPVREYWWLPVAAAGGLLLAGAWYAARVARR